jgi:hypothetical protein
MLHIGKKKTPANPVPLGRDPRRPTARDPRTLADGGHRGLGEQLAHAGHSLSKREMSGVRAQALLYLDHSSSMRADYTSGAVQALVERALAFALAIDADGVIPVIPWSSTLPDSTPVTDGNYRGVVDRELWHPAEMGTTRLDLALHDLRARARHTTQPLLAMVLTDGDPDEVCRPDVVDLVCDLARHPAYLKFLALRDVPFLRALAGLTAGRRLVDNTDVKSFPHLDALGDFEFAEAMADGWDRWARDARAAGVIR